MRSDGGRAMEIWILRHAKAEEGGPGTPDEERALTAAARKRMQDAARTIARMKPRFDAILTSPLRRARQTAEPVARALGRRAKLVETEALYPGSDPKEILRGVEERKLGRVLLVGHMPHLGYLLGYLLTGRVNVPIEMKKGALARVEFDGETPKPPGTLTLLLTSKDLARTTGPAGRD
jgi:phosphohistidine phosphatase